MIGDFSVGKTSLTARFVKNMFSEEYLSTVGVKIDSKEVSIDNDTKLKLMVWDVAGKEKFTTLDDNYLRGSSGYMLVADGTRKNTIENAFKLQKHMVDKFGPLPFCMLINKHDLTEEWEFSSQDLDMLVAKGWRYFMTSAKQGENVEEAFSALGKMLVK